MVPTSDRRIARLYDEGIAACLASNGRQAEAALMGLIGVLNFEYEAAAMGLFRLYDHCLRETRAGRFARPLEILRTLREAWDLGRGRHADG